MNLPDFTSPSQPASEPPKQDIWWLLKHGRNAVIIAAIMGLCASGGITYAIKRSGGLASQLTPDSSSPADKSPANDTTAILDGGNPYVSDNASDGNASSDTPTAVPAVETTPVPVTPAPAAAPTNQGATAKAKAALGSDQVATAKPQTVAKAPVVTPPKTTVTTPPKAVTVTPPKVVTPAPVVPKLYVNPSTPAADQANKWAASRPGDAALMRRMASYQIAEWYGGWTNNITSAVNGYVSKAASAGQVPLLVAYNIPNRDCGSYSAGGAGNAGDYANWIQGFANGIGRRSAIVVLEPDALPADCVNNGRLSMIADAVNRFRATTNAAVYIDAGNAGWIDAGTMSGRLRSANVAAAAGYAINVSNFKTTSSSTSYGNAISPQVGNKHFVIDTSRNGKGDNGQWCNPSGRAAGQAPTLSTGVANVDAYLWIKRIGESDGTCNGGPSAGQWWADYALGLAKNAGW